MSGFTMVVADTNPIVLEFGLSVPIVQGEVQQGGGSQRYEITIDSSQLNPNGEYVAFHNLPQNPSTVRLLDENRERVFPDYERDFDNGNVKALTLGLLSFVPFSNFLLVLEV